MRNIIIVVVACLMFFAACRREADIQTSFYYWKSAFLIGNDEAALLDSLAINELYVKYFDVKWNRNTSAAEPVAVITFPDSASRHYAMIPVVYITVDALRNTPDNAIPALAGKVLSLIKQINAATGVHMREVQFDCDWTDQTRSAYFHLLQWIRQHLPADTRLSATIRLHQVKYRLRTGVPPVDRGMLMFYNMGELGQLEGPNSIYNAQTAGKYVSFCKNYPLPLDVALPAYSWGIHFREGKGMGILERLRAEELERDTLFEKKSPFLFQAKQSRLLHGDYFIMGDFVKIETISPALCEEAAKMLAPDVKKEDRKVVFFDLDSSTISNYTIENFRQITDRFR